MNPAQISFVTIVAASVSASAAIGVMALRRAKRIESGRWLGIMALAQSAWSALYLGEVVAPTLPGKIRWDKLQWGPTVLAILAMWTFSLRFAGGRERALRIGWRINLAVGAGFLGLVASEPWHGLGYLRPHLVAEPFPALLYDFGPSLLGGVLWLYVLATWGLVELVRRAISTRTLYRRQVVLVLLGTIIPYAGGFFTLSGATWDISPFTFAASDLVLGFALFRYGLLQTIPIARELVLDHMSDGVLVEDPSGRLVDLNPAAARLLGERAVGSVGGSLEALAARIGVAAPPPSGVVNWELAGDGEPRTLDVAVTPIPDRHGRPAGRVLVVRDVTALRQAHRESERAAEELARVNRDLERANRSLEAFNHSVSHDLQAPLRHIRSFATILAEEAGEQLTPEASELTARIQRASERMSGLIAGLLRLAKAGRAPQSSEPLALDQLAADLVEQLQSAAPDRRIEVRIASALHATGDRALVGGLLQNLLENAFKFTRGRVAPVIEIGRELTDRGPSFFVRDNGVGFDPRHADRLFLPFQKMHAEGEYEGTGIGLSLVKQIAERHGGDAWAVSALGLGTTVYFTLAPTAPRRDPAPDRARDHASPG